jgi:hypothetical protein
MQKELNVILDRLLESGVDMGFIGELEEVFDSMECRIEELEYVVEMMEDNK